jgi:hypothetical protein
MLRPARGPAAQDPFMPALYYRLLVAFAASLSLLLGACAATRQTQQDATVADLPVKQEASTGPEEMDTESTIWTLLGVAKKPNQIPGPETGPGVSPVVWQAVIDTLGFTQMDSLDPVAGLAVTKWYTPKNKPNDRYRVTAFVKARALRSDSVVVTVERQTRSGPNQWQDATVGSDVADNLENDILERARQIHIARLRALQ